MPNEEMDLDALLTAHTLGEPLTPEQRARVDAALADGRGPHARDLDETRELADLLTRALHEEPDLPAPHPHRLPSHEERPVQDSPNNASPMRLFPAISAVAAMLIVGLGVYVALTPRDATDDRQLAVLDDADRAEAAPQFGLRREAPPVDAVAELEAEAREPALQQQQQQMAQAAEQVTKQPTRARAAVPAAEPAMAVESAAADLGLESYFDGGFGGGGGGDAAPRLVRPGPDLPRVIDEREHIPLLDQLPDADELEFDTEAYDRITDNPFRAVADAPLSTFGVDVDAASYANVRRFLTDGRLPPPDAVRVEELINYFPYTYAAPDDGRPFAASLAVTDAPWAAGHKLVRVALKAAERDPADRPAANLVFLLDVSGSMDAPDKLPLVKDAMKTLLDRLRDDDRVAIVTYAGHSGLVLPPTPAEDRLRIRNAIDTLAPGGGTRGSAGIELAYAVAADHFVEGGINRVVLATDGDFNLGTTDRGGLTRLVEDKAKSGVYLTVLGFGTGNVKDATMEELSNLGEGNYAYIDSAREAEKVLGEQVGGTLDAVAKDVKLQVEFNPAHVAAYRLIGYENRLLRREDFDDDTKDAGDLGMGHTVTALYEIIPTGESDALADRRARLEADVAALTDALAVDGLDAAAVAGLRRRLDAAGVQLALLDRLNRPAEGLAFQEPAAVVPSDDLLRVKLRYKAPDAPKTQGTSELIEFTLGHAAAVPLAEADDDFRFAAAVAAWGMLLRDSPHAGDATYDAIVDLAKPAATDAYRREFVDLVKRSATLDE